MILALLLIAMGLLAVFLEFYLPGGLMAIIGVTMILGGLVWFASASQSVGWTLLVIVTTVVVVTGLIKYALRRIRNTKGSYSVYSDKDQEGFRGAEYESSVMGMEGVALCDLRPAGRIEIDGKVYQALSQGEYIEKGSSVKVIRGQEASLIVSKKV